MIDSIMWILSSSGIRLSRRSEMNLFIICLSTFYNERKLVWKDLSLHRGAAASCMAQGGQPGKHAPTAAALSLGSPECCFS